MKTLERLWRQLWGDVRGTLSAESCMALLLGPALLSLYRYIGQTALFRRMAATWSAHPLFGLYPYLWWYGVAVVFLLVIPSAVSRWGFSRRFSEMGGQWGDKRAARPVFLGVAVMGLLILPVSFVPEFARKYPLCDLARDQLSAFVMYELAYGLYFFAWEFFFRGWMLQGLVADFGTRAIWIQTLPFVVAHFGKPLPETLGAIPAGLFLGWLAWRTKSFYYGWFLHWGVAFLLDTAIVIRLHL